MQSLITVVVMVIVRLATFALPAKSKYAGTLPRNYQCRVVITDQTILPMRPGYRHVGAENFYQLSAQVYKGLNCTESYRPSVITTGSRQQDGNYTGILGLFQRDVSRLLENERQGPRFCVFPNITPRGGLRSASDKVVYLDADAIHTLSDQLRAPFDITKKPVAFKKFYLYDYLLISREESDLFKLHKLMADNGNLLDLKLDRENEILPAIAKADQAMFAGSSSMVLEKFLYYSLFSNYQCAASGGNDGGNVSASYADIVLAYFVNRKRDPQLKDLFDRRTKVIFESHVLKA
ncbi:hypothetical protein HDE_00917 [Halotydeus destructor]|nr:hypothetical protein HDE_00917 [Halotydeus destructor]